MHSGYRASWSNFAIVGSITGAQLFTRAPEPSSLRIKSCAARVSYAIKTVLREIPSMRASVRVDGRRASRPSLPSQIIWAIWREICVCNGSSEARSSRISGRAINLKVAP